MFNNVMNKITESKNKVGLIFGKFYPLHTGHLYLIEKAASFVEELHVFLGCEAQRDLLLYQKSKLPKMPQVADRYCWLKQTFLSRKNITIHILNEEGIETYPNGWQDWSDKVLSILKSISVTPNVIFTSEPQDEPHYQYYFNCSTHLIDASRNFMPISATKIRQAPYYNWNFIAPKARYFFVKTITIKSQNEHLLKKLANIYATNFVYEAQIDDLLNYDQQTLPNHVTHHDFVSRCLSFAHQLDNALIVANKITFTHANFRSLHDLYIKAYNQTSAVLADLENRYEFNEFNTQCELNQINSEAKLFDLIIKYTNNLLI